MIKNLAIFAVVIFSFLLGYRFGNSSRPTIDSYSNKLNAKENSKQKIVAVEKREIIESKKILVSELKSKEEEKKEEKKDKGESYLSRMTSLLADGARLQEYIEKCEDEDGYDCHMVEKYYLMTGQYKKYKFNLLTSCYGQKFNDCRKLYGMMSEDEKKNIEDLTYTSCMNDNAEACDIYGTLSGWQVPSERSLSIKKRACDLDEEKCLSYAHYLDRTKDPNVDQFVKRGCMGSDKDSYNCISAANLFLRKGKMREAASMLEFGCKLGTRGSCGDLYHLYLGMKLTDRAEKLKSEMCQRKEDASWHFGCK